MQTADTVIVYLHWGTELDACPNPLQEPLAQVLVQAGADIIVGTHAHVLLGGGYLGSAYVDYGLGNFAFYDNSPPENASGSLVITATGRHIDAVDLRTRIAKGPFVASEAKFAGLVVEVVDVAVAARDHQRVGPGLEVTMPIGE